MEITRSKLNGSERVNLSINKSKLTRAYNATFDVISIDDMNETNRDNCFCIGCGIQLSAKLGKVNAHHFAHRGKNLKSITLAGFDPVNVCGWSHESEVHIIAKEYIESVMKLMLPIGTINPSNKVIEFDSVELERTLNGRIPDIIATVNGERVLIEIAVTHKCESDKISEMRSNNLNCIEIDLKNYRRTGDVIDHEQIKQLMIRADATWLSVSTSNQFGKMIHDHDKVQLKEGIREFNNIDGKSNAALNDLRAEYRKNRDDLEINITERKKELATINSNIKQGHIDAKRCQYKLNSINENIVTASRDLEGVEGNIADIDTDNLLARELSVSVSEKLNIAESNRLSEVASDINSRLESCEEKELDLKKMLVNDNRTKSDIKRLSIRLDAERAELNIKIKAYNDAELQAEETLNKRLRAINDDAKRAESAINKRIKSMNEEVEREAKIIVERMYEVKLNQANSALKIVKGKVKIILNKTKSILPVKIRNEILEMIE